MANLLSKYVVPGCRVDLQEIEHTELDDEMDTRARYWTFCRKTR